MLEKKDLVNIFLEKALKYNQNHNLFNRNNKKELQRDVNESLSINPFIKNKLKITLLQWQYLRKNLGL